MNNPLTQHLLKQVEDNANKRNEAKPNSLFSKEDLKQYLEMMEDSVNVPLKDFMRYMPLFVESLSKNMNINELRALATEFDRTFWYPLTVHVLGTDGSVIYDIPPRGNYGFTINERKNSNFQGVDNLLEHYHSVSKGDTYGNLTLEQAGAKTTVSLGQALAGINLEQRNNINVIAEVEKALIANRNRGVLKDVDAEKNTSTEIKDETKENEPFTIPEPQNQPPPSWDAKSLPDIPL